MAMKHLSGEPMDVVTLRIEFPHNEGLEPLVGDAQLLHIDRVLDDGFVGLPVLLFTQEHRRRIGEVLDGNDGYDAAWFVLSDGRDDAGAVVLEVVEAEVINAGGRTRTIKATFDPDLGPDDLALTLPYSKYLYARAAGGVLIDVPKAVEAAHVGFWALTNISYEIEVDGIPLSRDEEIWSLMRPEQWKAKIGHA